MKKLVYLSVFSLFIACQTKPDNSLASQSENETNTQKGFNAEKANKYGADDYGMKTYVMAFLRVGPNRPKDSATSVQLQKAHMDNINRLAEAGMLVTAGPFIGNDDLRGIYIFDTDDLKLAESLVETDPAIQSGSLVMDLRRWYGSAALMEVNQIHESLAKEEI